MHRLARERRRVRRQYDVGQRQQRVADIRRLGGVDIKTSASNRAVAQGVHQGLGVDDRAARCIYDDARWSHLTNYARIEKISRRIRKRQMNRHHIARRHEFGNVRDSRHARWGRGGATGVDRHLHPEPARCHITEDAPDASESDDAQCLPVHVAETKPQAVYAFDRWGTTIVGRLDDVGLLGPGFVGAHAIWTTAEDALLLAATGSAIAHNPASNLKTGSGIAPVRELLDAGVSVGIGTDGSITSDNQNAFEAMRLAGLVGHARYPYQQDRWLTAVDVLRMEFEGGAKILQRSGDLGVVKPGYKADLMLLRTDSITLSPMNDPANTLVYSESGSSVDLVLVDGRVVMQGGSVLGVDEAAIRQTANATLQRLRGTTRGARSEAIEIRPFVTEACRRAARSPYPVDRYVSGGQTPEEARASPE